MAAFFPHQSLIYYRISQSILHCESPKSVICGISHTYLATKWFFGKPPIDVVFCKINFS